MMRGTTFPSIVWPPCDPMLWYIHYLAREEPAIDLATDYYFFGAKKYFVGGGMTTTPGMLLQEVRARYSKMSCRPVDCSSWNSQRLRRSNNLETLLRARLPTKGIHFEIYTSIRKDAGRIAMEVWPGLQEHGKLPRETIRTLLLRL